MDSRIEMLYSELLDSNKWQRRKEGKKRPPRQSLPLHKGRLWHGAQF